MPNNNQASLYIYTKPKEEPITFVHILIAIEYNDVIITHNLQSHEHFLIFFSQITEHKLHINLDTVRNILCPVDHPEKMPTWILIRKCKDSNKNPNLIINRRRRQQWSLR